MSDGEIARVIESPPASWGPSTWERYIEIGGARIYWGEPLNVVAEKINAAIAPILKKAEEAGERRSYEGLGWGSITRAELDDLRREVAEFPEMLRREREKALEEARKQDTTKCQKCGHRGSSGPAYQQMRIQRDTKNTGGKK